MPNTPIEVLFPTGLLKPSEALLDPQNTETIWEYYLLENLSCGLVRDSQNAAIGYEGCLAERFYKKNSNTWIFEIRNLKWSDGSEVLASEIENWINNLRTKPHRHIRFLKLLKSIDFNLSTRQLKLEFPFPMDNSILHELSLADSGLMPTLFEKNGWYKTIGPYKVKSWNISDKILALNSNTYSPLYHKEMPQEAILKFVKSDEEKQELFSSISIDILPTTAMTDPNLLTKFKKNSFQMINAHPSTIFFIRFNYLNIDSHNLNFRLKIANIIGKIRERIDSITIGEFSLIKETQMIPSGFSGRLESDSYDLPIYNPSGEVKKFKIQFPVELKKLPKLAEIFIQSFRKDNFDLTIEYVSGDSHSKEEIASCYVFTGNQLDSSGSWSFILGPPHGPLNQWLPELKDEFENIFSAKTGNERLLASKILHRKILKEAYAIPFMIGQQRYFLSNRINAYQWNPFDSRLRLYDLRLQ